MNASRKSERGQIVVIFVVALVAILALAALAIDGGLLMSNRRQGQGAADASALSGAGAAAQWLESEEMTFVNFDCNDLLATEDTFTEAALNTAALNNITNLVNDPGNDPSNELNGIEVVCVRNGLRRYVDVYTVITTEQEGSFSQLFSNGPVTNTVTAVARVYPHTPPAYGGAIVALGACGCTDTGINFGGNAEVHVTNGGMWANRDIVVGGSYDVDVRDGDGDVMDGSVNCLGVCDIEDDPNFRPDAVDLCSASNPQTGCADLAVQPLNIPEPTCGTNRGAFSTTSCPGGLCQPGTYTGGQLNTEQLRLMPGLYCITGTLRINANAKFESIPDANGHGGVTLFVKKSSGYLAIEGGDIDLSAPLTPEQVTAGAIQGVLIYYQNGNGNDFRITGNGDGDFTGMIYSKDSGLYAAGTTADNFTGQIIMRWIEAKGTSDMKVTFADFTTLAKPTTLQLQK